MDRTYAFVDESGNSDLDTSKGGSSGFFIVCSILVAEKDLEAAYAQAEALRKQHFQTGEIKSSNLKPKVRIPRHLDTQPTIIWTLVPRALGHLIHVHLDRQSERSDAGLHC